MRVLLDTNVIIDVLEERAPFFECSNRVFLMSLDGGIECFVSAGAVTDIYYIIRRFWRDAGKSLEAVRNLLTIVSVIDTAAVDVFYALSHEVADFEDAVQAASARRECLDYIITRNEADFAGSTVPAVSPERFLRDIA
jgi:predicted nucleic acid-binding protein